MTLATNHETPFGNGQHMWKQNRESTKGYIIYIQYWIKELWPGQEMNMHTVRRTGRQTDSQGDSYITP